MADDQGRMPGNPAYIRSIVWPYDDISIAETSTDLDAIELAGNIIRYIDSNSEYIQIANWHIYQGDSQWLGRSSYPAPQGWIDHCRYHGKGNQIITENWDTRDQPNRLPSQLPRELPSTLSCRDGEGEGDGNGDAKATTAVFSYYQANIGGLNKHLSDIIGEAIDKYPPGWIEKAIDVAVEANVRKWAYISAILERWNTEGFDTGKRKETIDPRNIPTEEY
jgi:DnaD/phage-associated family protein